MSPCKTSTQAQRETQATRLGSLPSSQVTPQGLPRLLNTTFSFIAGGSRYDTGLAHWPAPAPHPRP